MGTSLSRIDPLSWVVVIDHAMPERDQDALWQYSAGAPAMKDIVHETLHFWHSFSTTCGIQLAFDCLKSMNALRFAARRGVDLRTIGSDFELDGYRLFPRLKSFMEAEHEIGTELSEFELFEGLARYWDMLIPADFSTSGEIERRVDEQDPLYGRAYQHARAIIGPRAFILFPIVAYLALNADTPVPWFHWTLKRYASTPFDVPSGNFQQAWDAAFEAIKASSIMFSKPYGPMTTYKTEHRRYVRWKSQYAELIPEDFPLTGHPILEDWVQNMMNMARDHHPGVPDVDLELTIFKNFVLPGNPMLRHELVQRFRPPLYLFSDGNAWVNPPIRFRSKPEFFRASMENLSALMGAAYNLMERAESGRRLAQKCPQASCPVHADALCGHVVRYPASVDACAFKPVLAHDFKIH
jgi:hypothetical protein